MRVARLSLIGAAIVALSLGLGSPAFGQSAEPVGPSAEPVGPSEESVDPMGANYWTGTWTFTDAESGVTTERTGYTEYLGEIVHGTVEADDPRMVGDWTQVNDVHFATSREPEEGNLAIVHGTARIDNDAGAWSGTFTTFGGQPGGEEWYVMEGEGAYEGLSTVFRFGEDGFAGVIMPSDLPPLPGAIAAPDPRTTPSLSGSFAVSDGRKLAIRCWGEGEPTIVLVGGHPSNGINDFEGQAFLRPLAERTRVCAYARSGYTGSDPAPNEPRDADDVDRDLHDLLESAGIDGPIVLVGGSFGGFIVAYYAAMHPEDVAGVVMLDVPAPSGTLTVEQAPEIAWDHPDNPEHTDTVAAFENRFAAERPPIQAPLVVLTAKDGDSSVDDQAIWLEISPSSRQVELDGGHGLAYDNPDGVAAEILKLLDELS